MTSDRIRARAILVLGMHRSGTSALTRVINLLGASLGSNLLPAAADNPSGFWEHREIVAVHDQLLHSLDRSWHDLRAMPQGWLSSAAAQTAKEQLTALLAREFADSPLWLVKDPRLCRVLPLWHQILDALDVQAHGVFVLRHPNEVAASLLARDGIAPERTRLSWLEHTVEAEKGSRELSRSVISYDNLLLDWRAGMHRLAREMAFTWPVSPEAIAAEVEQFLRPDGRHHDSRDNQRELPEMVRQVYDAFSLQANDPGAGWDAIKRASDVYLGSADIFLEVIDALTARLGDAELQNHQREAEFQKLSARLDGFSAALSEYEAVTHLHRGLSSRVPIEDCAKVYYRHGDEAYGEDRSIRVGHDGMRDPVCLKFALPADAKIDYVRFDPSEFPGEFAIRDFRFAGEPISSLDTRLSSGNSHVFAVGDDEFRIGSIDNDPNVELDVRDMDVSDGQVIEIAVSCYRVTVHREIRSLVDSALKLELGRTSNAIVQDIEAAGASLHELTADYISGASGTDHPSSSMLAFHHDDSEDGESRREWRKALESLHAQQLQAMKNQGEALDQLSVLSSVCGELSARLRDADIRRADETAALKKQLDSLLELHQRAFVQQTKQKLS